VAISTSGQHGVDFAVLNHPHRQFPGRGSRWLQAVATARFARDFECDGQMSLTRLMMLPGMKNGDTFFGE